MNEDYKRRLFDLNDEAERREDRAAVIMAGVVSALLVAIVIGAAVVIHAAN